MGKIIAELSPGQSAGHDPWAWGSKCRPRRAGITGREVPWEPKNGRETRGNICLEIGKKMETFCGSVGAENGWETRKMTILGPQNSDVKWCQKRV